MSLPDMEAAMSPKGMQPEHMDPMYERTPWLAGLDWAIRFWRYFDSRLSAVRYLIAGCSFYGGMFFIVGASCGIAPALADNYLGGWDAYTWSVIFTFFVGTYIFTLGCFLLSVEASNRNYPERVEEYKSGQRPTKPKFRLLWVDAKNLGWWGGVSYTFGALLYNVGSTATLASTWKTFTLNELKYLTLLPYLLGGPFFFASGVLYCIEFSGPNVLKSVLPIPGFVKHGDLTTFTWWVNFNNFWGGTLFCISGFWGYFYYNIPIWQWRIQNVVGFGLGGLFFVIAGLLLYIQMALARCCHAPETLLVARQGQSKADTEASIGSPARLPMDGSMTGSSFGSHQHLIK